MSSKVLSACVRHTFGRRFLSVASSLLAILCVFAASAHAATYTVTDLTDNATDTGSLRYAMIHAASGDTIVFSSGLTGTITLGSGLPAITGNLTITGPGANQLTISGSNSATVGSVFVVESGAAVTISGLTIAHGVGTCGGSSFDYGGGICVDGGTITVNNDAFINNSANVGGGIYNQGTLTVSNSTFSGNSSTSNGAAIANAGTAVVTNSTFFGNSSTSGGGAGIFTEGTSLKVANSTFDGNSSSTAGAALANSSGTMSVANSILTANSQGGECFGNGCPTNGSDGNVVGVSANLLPLGNYGGPTQTMLPLPGSAAICAGSSSNVPSGVSTDQRGFPLTSSCVDAGAVQTNYLTVTTNADSSDGSCTSTLCSLRDAIGAANSAGTGDIDFATSLNGQTITLGSALPGLSGQEDVVGPGANLLTVSGNNSATVGSVFVIDSGAQVTLEGLTIANGNTGIGGGGGGIFNDATLTVMNSTLSGNATGDGGGIFNAATLTVTNSTITNNQARNAGGGILNNATLTVMNSTFTNNHTNTLGGAIDDAATVTVMNSTFAGNSASFGGGIFGTGMTVTNGIFSNNSATQNGAGIFNSGTVNADYNVYYQNRTGGSEDDCNGCNSNTHATDATSAVVAPLGYYGGPTQTMAPLGTSAALNAGAYQAGEPTTDQRGAPRPSTAGAAIDAGSVQVSGNVPMIGSVTPNKGPAAGGTLVTITGTGLSGVTAVNFGSVPSGPFGLTGTPTTLAVMTVTSPAAASSDVVDITVTSAAGTSATSSNDQFTYIEPISIAPATGFTFAATAGVAFSQAFTASGGTSPYTFTVSGGALPTGITLSSNGALTGTSMVAGTFTFQVTVTDSAANTVTGSYIMSITAPTIIVSSAGTPSGTVGMSYSGAFSASGGAAPYVFAVAGTLPPGLTFDAVTGVLTGTPTAAGSFTFVIVATDSNGFTGSTPSEITILKGSPTLTWNAPAAISYGTQLGATQLDATSNVPGTFTYTPPAGTVLNAGANQPLSATFAPKDGADYNTATVATSITVAQATLNVTANNASRAYGTANPTFNGSVSGAVNGDSFTESFTTIATPTSNVGTYPIVPSVTGTNLGEYIVHTSDGALTVTQAATTTALSASSGTIKAGQSVTLTAQVQSATIGTPTGSVNFYDGTVLLGTATLSGGSASITTSALNAGATNSLTAAYQGSTDFAASTSSSTVMIAVGPLDFTLTYQGGTLAGINSGTTLTYTFQVSPNDIVYPGQVTFAASGLPSGATTTFNPSSVAANGGTQTVTMQLQTAPTAARKDTPFKRRGAPLVLGVMLLPLLGMRRMRNSRLGRNLMLLLVITAGGIGLASLSGCGSASTIQTAKDYHITVTASSGTVQHSFSVTLIIEPPAS